MGASTTRSKFREASRGKFHAILVIVSNNPGQLDINNFTSTAFRFKHGQHSTTLGLKYHPLFQTDHLEVSHDSPGAARCGDGRAVGEQAAAIERPAAVGEPAGGQR
jgi:hypothetical protein